MGGCLGAALDPDTTMGAEKQFLVTAYIFIFAGNPREGGEGVQKFFPYTYLQNFHQMWMFLAEWLVYCIESKHDK